MYQRLRTIDPLAAAKIAANDTQRIQRALEVYELTGETMSALISRNPPQPPPYEIINIVVAPSSRLQQLSRIEKRFQEMLQQGFLAEVELLLKRGDLYPDLPSMRAVGYRQVWRYLIGEIDYQTMQQQAIIATRQLAKRQLTWLRRWDKTVWFDSDDEKFDYQVMKFITEACRC
jgi:tRNA dimethylallyltransferase